MSEVNHNSLSLIRLLAALQVILFHLINNFQVSIYSCLSTSLFYFRGVPIFFIISGFLIWFSMERSRSYDEYIKKRFWRIYPELWMAVLIELITIVVLYNKANLVHLGLFAIAQGTIFQFWTPSSLREYGCGTPNGALWTISVMIQFYIIAWLIRKMLHNKNWIYWIASFAGLLITSIVGQIVVDKTGVEIVSKLYGQTIIKYCWLFFIGCFIAEFKDKTLPLLTRFWYLFLVGGVVPYMTGFDIYAGYFVLWSVLMVSGLIGFAYRFAGLEIKVDISYGLFLYHMIIMNAFIELGLSGCWMYALILVILTILFAWGSCITIGKWALIKRTNI